MPSPLRRPADAMPAAHDHHTPEWLVLALVCVAQFMVVLDISVVNVALPSMQRSLHFTETNLQWVVTAYALTFGGLLLLGGRAADLFGRRRIFLVGLALFTGASLLGGFASDQVTLVAARGLQGVGAAVLSPATLTILTVTFTEVRARARALAAWSSVAAGGGAAGALVGGLLTQYLSWRWILFVNVPIGVVVFAVARLSLAESRVEGRRPSLDVGGSLAVTVGLVALVYAIVNTDQVPWTATSTLLVLAAAVVLLAGFVVVEWRSDQPLVPLRLFRSRALAGANAVMVCFGAAMFAMWFFLTLYLQQVLGYSPLATGLAFLPQTAAIAAGAMVSGRISPRVGPRRMLVVGSVLAAGGLFWLTSITPAGSYWDGPFVGGMLCALGMGLAFTPITLAATLGVARAEAGLASGLVNTSRQVGASIGLAALSTIAADRVRAAHLAPGANGFAVARAMTAGYSRGFLVAACIAVTGGLVSLVVPARGRAPAGGHEVPEASRAPEGDLEDAVPLAPLVLD